MHFLLNYFVSFSVFSATASSVFAGSASTGVSTASLAGFLAKSSLRVISLSSILAPTNSLVLEAFPVLSLK